MGAIRKTSLVGHGGQPLSVRLAPSLHRIQGDAVAITAQEREAGLILQIEIDLGAGVELGVVVRQTLAAMPHTLEALPASLVPPEPRETRGEGGRVLLSVPLALPGGGIRSLVLQVGVYRHDGRWELLDEDRLEILQLCEQPTGWWTDHPVPHDLIELVVRLGAGEGGGPEALGRLVEGLARDRTGRWLYRPHGSDFLVDTNDAGPSMLDLMLALRDRQGPSKVVAVSCQALARLVVAAAQLLGLQAQIVRLEENKALSGQEVFGTVRVLPLGQERWQYPTLSGTLSFHEVAMLGDCVFDASFQLDGSKNPLVRPHGPPVPTAGRPLLEFLSRLSPEICAGAWCPPQGVAWPTRWPKPLEVVPPERCRVRRVDESLLSFAHELESLLGPSLAQVLTSLERDGLEAVAACVPDQHRAVLFFEGENRPLEVDIAWARESLGPQGLRGLLPRAARPPEPKDLRVRALGEEPAEEPLVARSVRRLLEMR